MSYLREHILSVCENYFSDAPDYITPEQYEKLNGATRFAYLAFKAFFDGQNKKNKIFDDDVKLELEEDPVTQFKKIYISKGHNRLRIIKMTSEARFNKNKISFDMDEFSLLSAATLESIEDEFVSNIDENLFDNEAIFLDSYASLESLLSNKELEDMRATFGFDADEESADNAEIYESDSDLDNSDESLFSRDERLFSEKYSDIMEWVRETQSYNEWVVSHEQEIINNLPITDRLKDVIDLEYWSQRLTESFEHNFSIYKTTALEWENSIGRFWDMDKEHNLVMDEYEDEEKYDSYDIFDRPCPHTPPDIILSADTFLQIPTVFDVVISNRSIRNRISFKIINLPFSVEGDIDSLLHFINPNGDVYFNILLELNVHKINSDLNVNKFLNEIPTPLYKKIISIRMRLSYF